MNVICLQSGSNGNCIYVEAEGVRLLFDAGIAGRTAQQRLAQRDRDILDVDGLLISHDHGDHTRCMGVYHRMFGLPVHVARKTLATARARRNLGRIDDVRPFAPGETLCFGRVRVETVPTPHDSADSVAFVVDDGRRRLGILTDMGHVFEGLRSVVQSLDAVVIESNYDTGLLEGGSYPEDLKARIRGPGGHLSNDEAAQLLAATASPQLRWACLAHLSEQNNEPRLALDTHRRTVPKRLSLCVAGRYEASDVLEV